MIVDFEKADKVFGNRWRELTDGCQRILVAGSGGVDSALTIGQACRYLGRERVTVIYRDIKSNPQHAEDIKLLQEKFGFRLYCVNANPVYDLIVSQVKEQFLANGDLWADEDSPEAEKLKFSEAFKSLKSVLTVPYADFIAKAIDFGKGRIAGTGNCEEDFVFRYFNKRGDGAVDFNILNGLFKLEVWQFADYIGVPKRIIDKIPSADLTGKGDKHNDESELASWAKSMGYDIEITYGSYKKMEEGLGAWAWRENHKWGVITGERRHFDGDALKYSLEYSAQQTMMILFLREVTMITQHKVNPAIPGMEREILLAEGAVK